MPGKSLGDYFRFQRWILVLIVAAFVVRFSLSLTGMPNTQIRWVSINVVLLVGLVYCAVAVHTRGFGAYKQLLGLLLVQNLVAHMLIALAILLGILAGLDSIFTAPEFFGGADGKTWVHFASHVLVWPLPALFGWLVGAIILLVTRRLYAPGTIVKS